MNVTTTGMDSPTEVAARTTPITVKNASGRSDRQSRAIVARMRQPSRHVDSLDADPSGRAPYGVSSSATGSSSASACTVSSVSISKPRESAGNVLTKRREKTR